jgi:glycosyltransferase involved in cell wall biosynthesis
VRGIFPYEYAQNPERFELENAYEQMDGFTWEEFESHELTYTIVLLPPLNVGGVRTKGLLFSSGVDVINTLHPVVKDSFITIANSRWSGYPWSSSADAWFTCYRNEARTKRYEKRVSPNLRKTLIPRQTADYTNEIQFAPKEGIRRDIDILIVASVDPVKNLGLLARALVVLRQNESSHKYRAVWAIGRSLAESAKFSTGQATLAEMEKVLGRIEDYLEPLGKVASYDMPALYSRAKVLFLPSKVEGKNRSIVEAQCCNAPVVALSEYNRVARGGEPVFPEAAGLAVSSNAEAVAEGLATVVKNYGDFRPREEYLKIGGRMKFFWDCLLSFSYFKQMMPHTSVTDNEQWINEQVRATYGLGLKEFMFYSSKNADLAVKHGLNGVNRADGVLQTKKLLNMYSSI